MSPDILFVVMLIVIVIQTIAIIYLSKARYETALKDEDRLVELVEYGCLSAIKEFDSTPEEVQPPPEEIPVVVEQKKRRKQ